MKSAEAAPVPSAAWCEKGMVYRMDNPNLIYGINGPVVTIRDTRDFSMMEMVFVGKERLVGEVIGIHIKDEVFTPDGKVDICKIRPVARLGYFDYTVVEKSFEMPAPRVSPKDQVLVDKGLEGKV